MGPILAILDNVSERRPLNAAIIIIIIIIIVIIALRTSGVWFHRLETVGLVGRSASLPPLAHQSPVDTKQPVV